MVVSLLLIFVLLRVFTTATTSWQRGEAQVDAYREARGALQLMARDLSTTIHPVTTNLDGTTSSANPLLPTLVLNRHTAPEPPPPGGAATLNEEIYCLTNIINSATPVTASSSNPSPVQTMASETCAVGYFCQWLPDIAAPGAAATRAPHAFALMRQFLNSDGVSARLQQSAGTTTPVAFLTLYARTSLVPGAAANTTPPAASSTQLAAYIWDLKFRIDTTQTATEDGEAAPTSGGSPTSTDKLPPYDHSTPPRVYDGQTAPYPSVLPSYVEIRFKALSTGAGRRLEGSSLQADNWKIPASGDNSEQAQIYNRVILPNARQFVLRVPLINSNPLPNP